jgi:hypothetical protein
MALVAVLGSSARYLFKKGTEAVGKVLKIKVLEGSKMLLTDALRNWSLGACMFAVVWCGMALGKSSLVPQN